MKKSVKSFGMIFVNALSVLLFLIAIMSPGVRAEELVIGFTPDIPPFIMGESGLEVDLFREAMKFRGHTFKVEHHPYKRLQIAVTKMGLDGAAAVRKTENDGAFYSDNFIAFHNVAVTKKKYGIVLEKISDLKGESILAWQNAYRDLGKEFKTLFSPDVKSAYRKKYYEIPLQLSQNKMFWKERARVIIIDHTIFLWYRKQLSKEMDTGEAVVFHNIFPGETHFQVAFKSRKIRDDFNMGLKRIRESGVYQELVDKYIK